ncbi:MAG: NnrS family protein [Bdellovibrionales bacterium]
MALGLMGIGAFFRLIATQLWPELYTTWILLSGLGWSLCFATLSIRLIPFLWKPRIDGRAH